MTKFYCLGCYTGKGLGGFTSNPKTDRKAATKSLLESAGAKLTDYSLLRGSYDFIATCEGTFNQMAAGKMVAESSEAVHNFIILEDINMNKIAELANKMTSTYKAPGK